MVGTLAPAAAVALGQWVVLRPYVRRAAWWVPATVGGGLVLSVVLLVVLVPASLAGGQRAAADLYGHPAILYPLLGTVVGLCQWPVLRPGSTRAGWWIAASALGYGLLGVADAAVRGGLAGRLASPALEATAGVAGVAAQETLRGAALVWLLSAPKSAVRHPPVTNASGA